MMFGAIVLEAGIGHFIGGQAAFAGIVLGSGSAIGAWVAANVALMFPLVIIAMLLTGLSLIFGILARLGSFVLALFAIFFILGMNSWFGNLAMLGTAIGFIFIGPGRYYGFDSYLLERAPALKFLA
jgi:uncharacterized membrane protein YphA (DoxX/SURF4 family)